MLPLAVPEGTFCPPRPCALLCSRDLLAFEGGSPELWVGGSALREGPVSFQRSLFTQRIIIIMMMWHLVLQDVVMASKECSSFKR